MIAACWIGSLMLIIGIIVCCISIMRQWRVSLPSVEAMLSGSGVRAESGFQPSCGLFANQCMSSNMSPTPGLTNAGMAAFDLPKSPGTASFGAINRFRTPKSRSPGPLAYEPESTLNFSRSTLSVSCSQPSFSFREKFTDRSGSPRAQTALHIPSGTGAPQPDSRRPTAPTFSMGKKGGVGPHARRATQYPSPLQYRMPVARVYETRGDRNFGSDDRFGNESSRSRPLIPGPSDYDSSDGSVRTDRHTLSSVPFGLRTGTQKHLDRSPGPQPAGDGWAAKDRVGKSQPSWSMGARDSHAPPGHPRRTVLHPSPAHYDARSLYWSNKRELGKPATAPGRARAAAGLSIHKDVQASQPTLLPTPELAVAH